MADVYKSVMQCRSCGLSKSPSNQSGIIHKMPKWVLDMACRVGLHQGDWIYNWRPYARFKYCDQTRICKACSGKSVRTEHIVLGWESNGFFSTTESGVCDFCHSVQFRKKPQTYR